MTTITDLKSVEKEWQGKKSVSTTVTLSDGTTGYLDDKGSDKGLRTNDAVDAIVITPEGKNYKKITLKKAQSAPVYTNTQSFSSPTNGLKLPLNPALSQVKANATIQAMRFCIDAFIADKITWDKIKEYHKEITGYLNDAINECSSE